MVVQDLQEPTDDFEVQPINIADAGDMGTP